MVFFNGLISQGKLCEPDGTLLTVAGEMLSLTVEVIILRHGLVNPGTSVIWKVRIFNSYLGNLRINRTVKLRYGLLAARIVSLGLLPTAHRSRY
jgi:hypothetical protein